MTRSCAKAYQHDQLHDPFGASAQDWSEQSVCPSRAPNPRAIQRLRDPSCAGRDGEPNDLEDVLLLLHILDGLTRWSALPCGAYLEPPRRFMIKDDLPRPVVGVSNLGEQLGDPILADDGCTRSRRAVRRDAPFDDGGPSSSERPVRS